MLVASKNVARWEWAKASLVTGGYYHIGLNAEFTPFKMNWLLGRVKLVSTAHRPRVMPREVMITRLNTYGEIHYESTMPLGTAVLFT